MFSMLLMQKVISDQRLTPDNQLGGDSDVVDGRLRCAGVAAGVLQLDLLDEQLAI